MNEANTLVASYCFPPYNDASGIVASKRVRVEGVPVDVICNAMDSLRSKDPSLARVSGHLVRRLAALRTPSAFSSWRSIAEFSVAGLATAQRWVRIQGSYEHLYSRAQFAASHFLAARIKRAFPDIRWKAEFSDPLSHDVLGQPRTTPMDEASPLIPEYRAMIEGAGFTAPSEFNGLAWCEQLVYSMADEIIFTNVHQRDFMLSVIDESALRERVAGIAVVAPHPTLPREYYGQIPSEYTVDDDVVNIGYFGNFYANRGVDTVLDQLAVLPRAMRDHLVLHIFTSNASMVNLRRSVEQRRLESAVRINPYVPFLEHLTLADRMDVLLVNDAQSPKGGVNPFLPSKISDYQGSVTPIWGILEEGSPMDALGADRIRYRSPIGHASSIRQQLATFATMAMRGEQP